MKRSNLLLSMIAVGFVVSMATNVEGQLFRRSNNCCGGQALYSAPAVRCPQPQIMNYSRPMANRRVYRVYRVQAQPAINYQMAPIVNNCGCNGNVVMGGTVMNGSLMGGTPMNGSIMGSSVIGNDGSVLYENGTGTAGNGWGNGLTGGTADQSCLTTRQSCYDGCANTCGSNLAACRAHCQCIYNQCEACKKGLAPPSCSASPRPACQAAQPNPCPMTLPPSQTPSP